MSIYKFTIKKKPNADGKHSIILRFIKDRKNTSKSLGKSCDYKDWSFEADRVKNSYEKHKQLNAFIDKYSKILDDAITYYELNDIDFTINELLGFINKQKTKSDRITYTQFHQQLIDELKDAEKISSAKIELDTLKSIIKFRQKENITFHEITPNFLFTYEAHLRSIKNKDSTIGIRFRTLRAVINKAIEREIIPKTLYPFETYKVSKIKDSSKKEFLDEHEVKKLIDYKPETNNSQFAKDFFLFSYYSRGINFIDTLLLKKSDISGDTVSYRRQKTGANVSFKLNEFTKKLIRKHSSPNSVYLFDFIKISNPSGTYIRNKKQKILTNYINTPLKTIMLELEIPKNITFYCARHSFATQLKFNNISIDIIKEALGHKDIKSTMSYLNSLPSKKLDQIIEDVLIV